MAILGGGFNNNGASNTPGSGGGLTEQEVKELFSSEGNATYDPETGVIGSTEQASYESVEVDDGPIFDNSGILLPVDNKILFGTGVGLARTDTEELSIVNNLGVLKDIKARNLVPIYVSGPDARPASPNAVNDEFNGTSLDPSWIIVNSTNLTVDFTNRGHVNLILPAMSSTTLHAIMKAFPVGATDFTIDIKSLLQGRKQNMNCGLILSDGITAGAGNQVTFGFSAGGGSVGLYAYSWTNFNNYVTDLATAIASIAQNLIYLRIRRVSTSYSVEYSTSHIPGTFSNNGMSVGFTPTHFGVFIFHNETSQPDTSLLVDWIRYYSSGTIEPWESDVYYTPA